MMFFFFQIALDGTIHCAWVGVYHDDITRSAIQSQRMQNSSTKEVSAGSTATTIQSLSLQYQGESHVFDENDLLSTNGDDRATSDIKQNVKLLEVLLMFHYTYMK